MAWIKLSEELYLSDQSPYSLEKIDGIWYVVDNSTQKKSIPFTDIFNNPVFPIDYSNTDMVVKSLTSPGSIEGKHFRGESANTPGTPAFSFQGDINSGIYRIDADKIGFSAGGSRQGEFGVGYGGFTGNIIQIISATNNFKNFSSVAGFFDVLSNTGVSWEISIIPKMSNSKIFVLCKLGTVSQSAYYGIRLLRKINAGSYNTIYEPQIASGTAGGLDFGSGFLTDYMNNSIVPVLDVPTYSIGDTLTYKSAIGFYTGGSGITVNFERLGAGANKQHSEFYLFEVAG